jgi:phosphatidylglycerophosphatase A
VAPGTAGTFVGMTIYVLGCLFTGSAWNFVNVVLVLVMFYPAIRLGDAGEKFYGHKDPSYVVLDEMMGYWISVMFLDFTWGTAIAAFAIFRIFDILKPFPADKAQDLKGGLGIMLDDYIAGVYTNLLLNFIIFTLKYLKLPIY